MPRRVNKIFHDEDTRKRIKVSNIIHRLQAHVDGEIELSPTQVNAARILLSKTLPDLASVEHSGEIATSKVVRVPAQSASTLQWANDHIPQQLKH